MAEEALAKAREIAARLSGISKTSLSAFMQLSTPSLICDVLQTDLLGGITGDLGKRKNRWGEEDQGGGGSAPGCKSVVPFLCSCSSFDSRNTPNAYPLLPQWVQCRERKFIFRAKTRK
jgi:hypothetical protein